MTVVGNQWVSEFIECKHAKRKMQMPENEMYNDLLSVKA